MSDFVETTIAEEEAGMTVEEVTNELKSIDVDVLDFSSSEETPPEVKEPEPVVEVKTEPAKEETRVATRLANLSKREKQLEARERAIKEADERLAKFDPGKLRENPSAFLAEQGIDVHELYNTITDQILAGDEEETNPRLSKLEKELHELRDADYNRQRSIAEKERETALAAFNNEIKTTIDSLPDDFEMIRANDSYDLVYDVIEKHYADTNEILEVSRAAKYVEEHLEKQLEKLMTLKKAQKKLSTQKPVVKKEVKTIDNASSAKVPSRAVNDDSEEERTLAAMRILNSM